MQDLAVDQQGETLLEGQVMGCGLDLLLLQGIEHAGEFQRLELFVGVLLEHGVSWSVGNQW